MTGEATELACPRCGRAWWPDDEAVLGYRCPSCGGQHLPARSVEQILLHEGGWTIERLRDEARPPAGPIGGCAACGGELGEVTVEGTPIDLCARCGSAWFDAGELEEVSASKHAERGAPRDIASAYLPDAIRPDGKPGRVVVEGPVSSQRGTLAAVATVVIVPWVLFLLSSGGDSSTDDTTTALTWLGTALAIGAIVFWARRSDTIVADVDARRLRGPRSGKWRSFDEVTDVRVWRRAARRDGATPFFRLEVRAPDASPLAALWFADAVRAHRAAFTLSQVLRVPVSTAALDAAREASSDDA